MSGCGARRGPPHRGVGTSAAAAALAALVLALALGCAGGRGREVLIYYTASLDGHLDGCTCFGYPTAGLVKTARLLRGRDRGSSLLLDAGDLYEAGPNAFLAGELGAAYRELGYDAVAAGEQDSSNGLEAFKADAAAGLFRAQNLAVDGRAVGSAQPMVFERGGIRIMVVAITGPESFDLYPAEFRARLSFRPADEVVESALASGQPADFAILLYHGSAAKAAALASRHPRLGAAIVGHERKLIDGESSVPIYSPGEDGNRVGMLRLRLTGSGAAKLDNKFALFDYVKDADDPAIRERVMRYNEYFVKSTGLERDVEASPGSGASGAFEFSYFYSPNCRSCLDFLGKRLPALSESTSTLIKAHKRNILDPAELEALDAELAKRGLEPSAFPVVVAAGGVLQGESEIDAHFEELVRGARLVSSPSTVGWGAEALKKGSSLVLVPVLAAGLLDGINPCAFTTIIFLLSSLALAGRGRKQILLIGACFTASVLVTYTAIGAGAFAILRSGEAFPLLARILRYGMALALLVFAALSFADFLRALAGRSGEMILQLPESAKLRIHAAIRDRRRAGGLILSSLALGALVATFELGCTGQVYLPTIVYLIKAEKGLRGYGYLVLYNLAFILPLVLVFIGAYLGLGSARLAELFKRRLATVKAATALLFLVFAVLIVL